MEGAMRSDPAAFMAAILVIGGGTMVFAWAHALTDDDIRSYTDRIPGLGAVLYRDQYHLADEMPAIAYVPHDDAAHDARRHEFLGFLAGRDEPNIGGLSGARIPPAESARQYRSITPALAGHRGFVVPASLAAVGGWLATAFHRQGFDHAYHRDRGVPEVAWAPTRSRMSHIRHVIRAHAGVHVLSPALFRSGWNAWLQPSPAQFVALSSTRVHVAIWSLEQWETQPQFGLFDRNGRMTRVGRAVRNALT